MDAFGLVPRRGIVHGLAVEKESVFRSRVDSPVMFDRAVYADFVALEWNLERLGAHHVENDLVGCGRPYGGVPTASMRTVQAQVVSSVNLASSITSALRIAVTAPFVHVARGFNDRAGRRSSWQKR